MPIIVGPTPPPGPIPPTPDAPLPVEYAQPLLSWTGWTGDTWTLGGDFKSMALLEADGRGGYVMPPVEHYDDTSATSDGAVWQGHTVLPRDLSWPLIIIGDTPQGLRDEHRRFMTTLRPDKTGTFTVAHPNGERRYLTLRYVSGGEGDFGVNAYGISWIRHGLTMRAYDPFFYGDEQVASFKYSPGVNFYGGSPGGFGPPFYISSSQTIDSAQITNPGDADAFGVWRLNGPFTSATVGFGANTITIPFAVSAGNWVEINTDRRVATIVDQTGANRWSSVASAAVKFAPLPASSTTTLTVTVVGAAAGMSVSFTYRPKFWRAW